MQYISFYKNRLPFKPKSNVVIYFDVMGVGFKRYYHFLNDHYDWIMEEFRRGGLEFCFLPRIANDMDLKKIYHYFNPQANENDYELNIGLYEDRDLLEYMVIDYDAQRLEPGLIQYMGEGFDKANTYTFSYTPLPHDIDEYSTCLVQEYVEQHGVRDAFFERRSSGHCFDRFFQTSRSAPLSRVSETPRMHPPISMSEEEDVEMVMSEVQMLIINDKIHRLITIPF
jgi:hypothetical protein